MHVMLLRMNSFVFTTLFFLSAGPRKSHNPKTMFRNATFEYRGGFIKEMSVMVIVLLLIAGPQGAYSQDSSREDRLVSISKVLLSNSQQLDSIESELLRIVKSGNDNSLESRKTTLTLLMIIDNIITICNYEANLFQLSKLVEEKRKKKFFIWSGNRLKDTKNKINGLFSIIESNQKYVKYPRSVQLIDDAKEPIQSSIRLLDKSIDLLEANKGIYFLD